MTNVWYLVIIFVHNHTTIMIMNCDTNKNTVESFIDRER